MFRSVPQSTVSTVEGVTRVNLDHVEGNWKQLKSAAREQWGKLTASDWDTVAGRKDQLLGKIEERYGMSKDEAQRQAVNWAHTLREQSKEA
jgi:uncharacterized protein YjbJ (UPF0337 family)